MSLLHFYIHLDTKRLLVNWKNISMLEVNVAWEDLRKFYEISTEAEKIIVRDYCGLFLRMKTRERSA